MSKNPKHRWWLQISGIYEKGWNAGKAGESEEANPYAQAASGSVFNGVQVQRYSAWLRGWTRAKSGLPLSDVNG